MSNPRKNFSKIYDQYIDKIYRFIFIKVNSQETAQDLTSETFLKGWEAFKKSQISNIRPQNANLQNQNKEIENIQAFLYQIARNLITDYYREKGRTQFVSVDSLPIADPRHNLEEITQIRSDLDTVKAGLANLNDEYKEMVIWHYIDDFSIPEIAKITGKPEGTVRVNLHRALKALKNELGNNQKEA